jgi:hypothetical protein
MHAKLFIIAVVGSIFILFGYGTALAQDTTPPTVGMSINGQTPFDGMTVQVRSTMYLSAGAEDDMPGVTLTVEVSDGRKVIFSTGSYQDATWTNLITWFKAPKTAGRVMTIKVTAYDAAGNTASTSTTVVTER